MLETTLYPDWHDKVVFGKDGPKPQKLIETEAFKTVLVGLEPTQTIPLHPSPASLYYILEGSGWFTVDNERFAVKAGAILVMPDGAKRAVEAETRLVFLGTQTAGQQG